MRRHLAILNKISTAIKSVAPDSEIYLYGSRARNTAGKGSDWDILVLLDTPEISLQSEIKIIDAVYEVEIETGEVITPVIYTKKEWCERPFSTPFFENITHDGIRI
jgi:predicted nucleotidyltransferase